jgi:4-amino-4-deoxy-L-arabinose transferase-like glycosyltransferase
MAPRRGVAWSLGLALAGWLLAATLPGVADYPPPTDWAEMEVAATAHSLAERGVYGNPLFSGFAASERRYHAFMPLYPVLLAGLFGLWGVGLAQARGLSVACAALTVALSFRLGRAAHGPSAGAAAAAALVVLPLAVGPAPIPLLGFARIVRYDVLVPVFVLAACLAFLRAERAGSAWGVALAGALVGLAVLAHVWGGLLLPVLLGVLAWRRGAGAPRPAAWLCAGFLLALAPWAAYVAQDVESFLGQMRRQQGRFEVLSPGFYIGNLLHEHWRYAPWVGGSFRRPELWPRPGLWCFVLAVVAGNLALLARLRRDRDVAGALLLATPPALALLMGLLLNQKRYPYTLLVLPFLALQAGVGLVALWRRGRLSRWAVSALGVAAVVEGGASVARTLRAARAAPRYAEATAAVARAVPAGSRVLIPHPLWLALPGRETRSLVLAHFLADPRLHPDGGALAMDEALRRIGPGYVVLDDRFTRYRNPANRPVEELWARLSDAVHRLCPERVGRFEAPGYDAATILRCRPAGAAR